MRVPGKSLRQIVPFQFNPRKRTANSTVRPAISAPIREPVSEGAVEQPVSGSLEHSEPSVQPPQQNAPVDPYSLTHEPICQVMSDLHLEWRGYEDFEIPRQAPNLLLAGDIGRFYDRIRFKAFLRRQCEKFDRVMLVPGNHEFYGMSRERGLRTGRDFEVELANFYLMDKKVVVLNENDTLILGCTLHSHIPDDYTRLTNDFRRVEGWTVQDHNEEHSIDLHWIEEELAKAASLGRRVIVATHYAPSFANTVRPDQEHNDLSHCFCSDALGKVRDWKGAEFISHWVFGHTHYNACFKEGNITILSNQPPGISPNDRSGRLFDPKCVI